ncbi:MAG: hypothetical protein MRY83_21640 [Flavobacteriales bacterium]|nr:hypothetical protein [Flavobacteriales bacterium]
MKNLFLSLTLALTCFITYNSEATEKESKAEIKVEVRGGYFDVYIVNKCSSDIRVSIRGNGSTNSFEVDGNDKEKKPVKAGYELYVDGDKIHTFSDSDSGDDFVICD